MDGRKLLRDILAFGKRQQVRLAQLRRRNLLWATIIGIVGFLSILLFGNFVTNFLTSAWALARLAARQPLGPASLFALIAIVLFEFTLFFVAFVMEARRQWGRTPRLPTQQERELIQDIRTIWNMHGRDTMQHLLNIFQTAVDDVASTQYWGALLREKVSTFEARITALDSALAPDSRESLGDVRARFNEMYSALLIACAWLAKLDEQKAIDLNSPRLHISEWYRSMKVFFYKLNELVQEPEHAKTLAIFPQHVFDAAYGDFLRAAGMGKAEASLPDDKPQARTQLPRFATEEQERTAQGPPSNEGPDDPSAS
jgi:hypothetical protein